MLNSMKQKTLIYLLIYTCLILGSGFIAGKAYQRHEFFKAHHKMMKKGGHEFKRHDKKRTHYQEKMLKKLTEKLSLTPEQVNQVQAISARHHEEMTVLQKEVKGKFSAHRETFRAQINDILTPEQKVIFEKMKHKRRQKKGHSKH